MILVCTHCPLCLLVTSKIIPVNIKTTPVQKRAHMMLRGTIQLLLNVELEMKLFIMKTMTQVTMMTTVSSDFYTASKLENASPDHCIVIIN